MSLDMNDKINILDVDIPELPIRINFEDYQGEKTFTDLTKLSLMDCDRLCSIAKDYLLYITKTDYEYIIITYPVILFRRMHSGHDFKPIFYDYPMSLIGSKGVGINSYVLADNFIKDNENNINNFQFKIEFRNSEKLKEGNFCVYNGGKPGVPRICNLALGAYVMYEYLTENGFTPEKISDNEYQLIMNVTSNNTAQMQTEDSNVSVPQTEQVGLKALNNLVNNYINKIETSLRIVDSKTTQYQSRLYGKGVNLQDLRNIISNKDNINRIKNSLIQYHEWKKAQYTEKAKDLEQQFEHDREVYKEARLTADEIKQVSSDVSNKLTLSYLNTAINCINNKISTLKKMSIEELQQNYFNAIDDPRYGLNTILDPEIVDQLSNIIATLVRGYQAFSTDFQNIVIVGPAGVGKTTMAYTLSYIFKSLQILCIGTTKIVTRADLVASYLGQTAPKTRTLLFSTLEGILFIDEAYQVGGCPKEDQYGMESLTEIVNFLDKYVGISVIIVAGYEKEMNECFFKRNEGLRRRFPNKFKLKSYNSIQLFKVFLTKVLQSLNYDIFSDFTDLMATYILIDFYNGRDYFVNFGGDMLILAGRFIRYYLSSGNVKTSLVNSIFEYCIRDHDESECNANINEYIRTYENTLRLL